ncbi:AAA family ATPase [Tellurirhabdus rosea]|uniref:AAA family ATPase n=1 Tax=Tellurirhabdus rosea TaxID=2674997 RepID=UPI00224DB244|nr:AAA family ATPase [Tellurirhabdus rosea]
MQLTIPEFSLILLTGASSAGKTTFARRHFRPTEVISSDHCRALITDDEADQTVSADAFALLHYIVDKRLKHRKLTVVDATNLQLSGRQTLLSLAHYYNCPALAIVLKLPFSTLQERHRLRPDRSFGEHILENHFREVQRTLDSLPFEGFRRTYVLETEEAVNNTVLERAAAEKA